jgi:signal transduction histidine kinase/ActR/RegA family two-component response regulator
MEYPGASMTEPPVEVGSSVEANGAHAELEERARRLRVAQLHGGVAVWGWNPATGELSVEPEIDALYGAAPGTMRTYADWAKRVHPDDLKQVEAEREPALARGEVVHHDFRIRLDSGEERWLAATARADFDAQGRIIRVLGINTDITARKAAERALAQRASLAAEREEALFVLARTRPAPIEEVFEEITRTAARLLRVQRCGVWLLSADGELLEPACLYDAERAVHDRSASLSAKLFPDYFRILRERKVVSAADALTHPATRAFAESYLNPLGIGAMLDAPIWRGGRLAGVLCHEHIGPARPWLADDEALASALADHISRVLEEQDRVRAEEALRESESRLRVALADLEKRVTERTAELAEANRQLTDRTNQLRRLALELTRAEERERRRVAQVLHDQLQQLLVGARLHADLMADELSNDDARERMKRVTRLIDESIRSSRSLTEELSPPGLHLVGLVEGFRWLARWMEQQHQLTVQVTATTVVDPDSEGVSALLFRCGRELLFNVVKHAGVKVAQVTIERVDGRQIRVTVADDGHGFDAAQYQADSNPGFGLFSIRERLSLLGGSMSITSSPATGTSVILQAPLPLPVAAPATRPFERHRADRPALPKPEKTSARIRVLLVDDHKILREGLVALLQNQADMEVVGEAPDGYAALNLVRTLRPDVVLMDINMPGLNGVDATRNISVEFPDVRVIGLSMHGADSAQAMREAGAVNFIHKAAHADEMLAAIRAAADRPNSQDREQAVLVSQT